MLSCDIASEEIAEGGDSGTTLAYGNTVVGTFVTFLWSVICGSVLVGDGLFWCLRLDVPKGTFDFAILSRTVRTDSEKFLCGDIVEGPIVLFIKELVSLNICFKRGF